MMVIMAAMIVGLTACGNTVGDMDLEAGESGIYIQEDGIVSYAVSETFDKEYYDENDLEEKIDAEVEDYNSNGQASVSDALKVDDFDVSGDVATLVLEFATDYDLLNYFKNYNNIESDMFYIGSIENNTDCTIKGDFVSPDNEQTAKGKEIRTMTEEHILIVNEQYKVQIDGTVSYISTNCSIDEDGIVTTAKADEGTSYIVYKTEE